MANQKHMGIPRLLWILAIMVLRVSFCRSQSGAVGLVYQLETINNGILSVQLTCSASGDWYDPYDGSEDYAGVTVGRSTEHGCQLVSPAGVGQTQSELGITYNTQPVSVYSPIVASGTEQYFASFWLYFLPCDDETEQCTADDGNEYPYADYWGYLAYLDDPTACPLAEDYCYGRYSDEEYLTEYYDLAYAYAGGAGFGSFGTFEVSAVAIELSPAFASLDTGESVTFTADAANTGGFLPTYQWTQVSGPGLGLTGSGSTYTYVAPGGISQPSTAVIKGCITNLTTTPVCQTVSVDLVPETITLATPSPNVLLADGISTSFLSANVSNAGSNPTVTWSSPVGSITSTGNETATYTAPNVSGAGSLFAQSNTGPVNIVASIGSPAVTATTTLTLVEPVTISNVSPTSITAGAAPTVVTITGTGFSANSSVSMASPSWPNISVSACAVTVPPTQIQCTVSIQANTSNITASQGVTITVSTTTSGLTSFASSNPVSIIAVVYTYGITLLTTSPSLTYGYGTMIAPYVTCKLSNGTACGGNVSNPQTANFQILSGPGSLSSTSNVGSTVFTDSVLIGYPAQNTVVQGCAAIAPTVCATTNFSIPATVIMLSPPVVSSALTGGHTQSFSASIQNEGVANNLTWTLSPSPSNAAAGSLSAPSTTIAIGSPTSGTSGPNTYTAPASITTPTTVTLKACMTANLNICSTPVAITLQPPPTFTVAATLSSSQTALSMGHTMTYAVNVSALYGFSGPVTLSVAGLPAGVTASFSTPSINTSGTATLTLNAAYSKSTYIGASTLTVTGTSGSLTISEPINLTTRPLQYKGTCGVQ